jgi:hypothetical protein
MADMILERLTHTLQGLVAVAVDFLPRVVAGLVVVALGWLVAFAVRLMIRRFLRLLKFDRFSERSGVAQTLIRADLPSPSDLVAWVVFWVIWVSFMVLGLSVLGIPTLQDEISRFFQFVPHIFVSLLILYVGFWAAHFFSRAALLAAVNSNFPLPKLLASFVQLGIAVLAVTMAFEQLNLAKTAVLIAFSITYGAVMIGLAIAFGLAGRFAARRVLEKQLRENEEEKEREASPI